VSRPANCRWLNVISCSDGDLKREDVSNEDLSDHDISDHDISGHDISGHDASGHDASGHDASGHDAVGMIELVERMTEAVPRESAGDSLTLPYDLRQKSRQRVCLDSGREAAILLSRGMRLVEGDCLRGADGTLVYVHVAPESVSTARTDDLLRLARACYHLGNRHVALQVGDGWLRYQPDHVLDEMVRGLGLHVTQEEVAFEPERGAYHGHGHADGHGHHSHGADDSAHTHFHSDSHSDEHAHDSDQEADEAPRLEGDRSPS
jgi:urease accessory protein